MNQLIYYLINNEIINHITTVRGLRLMSSALVSKKWQSLKQRYFWK